MCTLSQNGYGAGFVPCGCLVSSSGRSAAKASGTKASGTKASGTKASGRRGRAGRNRISKKPLARISRGMRRGILPQRSSSATESLGNLPFMRTYPLSSDTLSYNNIEYPTKAWEPTSCCAVRRCDPRSYRMRRRDPRKYDHATQDFGMSTSPEF